MRHSKTLLIVVTELFVSCFSVGVVFYHVIEGIRLVDAIYMTAMTLTTVGYGDFTPRTDVGKLFTSVYAFVGVMLFLGYAAAVFEFMLGRFRK